MSEEKLTINSSDFDLFAEDLVIKMPIEDTEIKEVKNWIFKFELPPDEDQFKIMLMMEGVDNLDEIAEKMKGVDVSNIADVMKNIDFSMLNKETIASTLEMRKEMIKLMADYLVEAPKWDSDKMTSEEYIAKLKPEYRNYLSQEFMQGLVVGLVGEKGKKFQLLHSEGGSTPS